MRKLALLIVAFGVIFSCGERNEQQGLSVMDCDSASTDVGRGKPMNPDTLVVAKVETQKLEVVTFRNDSSLGGWGFDIYVDGRRYIHQPTVPVVAGAIGFETREQSERAGGMMVAKIKEGRMPPALDEKDLDLLGFK